MRLIPCLYNIDTNRFIGNLTVNSLMFFVNLDFNKGMHLCQVTILQICMVTTASFQIPNSEIKLLISHDTTT